MSKERKGYAGAKPIDAVLMVKMLFLQHLQLLTDEGIEHQLRNQLSFMHFLSGNWKTRCDDSAYRSMEHEEKIRCRQQAQPDLREDFAGAPPDGYPKGN